MATGASLDEALFGSTADGTGQAAPKKPGAIRIGVLEPVNKSARTLNTRGLREALVGKFKAPYEALPLAGSSAAASDADAARLQCDYILLAELTEVKSSKPGKVGGLLKAASGGGPSKDVQNVKASVPAVRRRRDDGPPCERRREGHQRRLRRRVGAEAGVNGRADVRGVRDDADDERLRPRDGGTGSPSCHPSSSGLGSKGLGYFDPRSMAMNAAISSLTSGLGGMGSMSVERRGFIRCRRPSNGLRVVRAHRQGGDGDGEARSAQPVAVSTAEDASRTSRTGH